MERLLRRGAGDRAATSNRMNARQSSPNDSRTATAAVARSSPSADQHQPLHTRLGAEAHDEEVRAAGHGRSLVPGHTEATRARRAGLERAHAPARQVEERDVEALSR